MNNLEEYFLETYDFLPRSLGSDYREEEVGDLGQYPEANLGYYPEYFYTLYSPFDQRSKIDPLLSTTKHPKSSLDNNELEQTQTSFCTNYQTLDLLIDSRLQERQLQYLREVEAKDQQNFLGSHCISQLSTNFETRSRLEHLEQSDLPCLRIEIKLSESKSFNASPEQKYSRCSVPQSACSDDEDIYENKSFDASISLEQGSILVGQSQRKQKRAGEKRISKCQQIKDESGLHKQYMNGSLLLVYTKRVDVLFKTLFRKIRKFYLKQFYAQTDFKKQHLKKSKKGSFQDFLVQFARETFPIEDLESFFQHKTQKGTNDMDTCYYELALCLGFLFHNSKMVRNENCSQFENYRKVNGLLYNFSPKFLDQTKHLNGLRVVLTHYFKNHLGSILGKCNSSTTKADDIKAAVQFLKDNYKLNC